MPEEKRISPAIVIIPVGLGLAAIGVLAALALAAPPKVYTCPYCGDEFATEEELLAHIQAEHPEEPPPGEVVLLSASVPPVLNKHGGDILPAEIYLRPRANAVAYSLYWRFSPRFEFGPSATSWIASQEFLDVKPKPDYIPLIGEGYYSCPGVVVCPWTLVGSFDVRLEVMRYWFYSPGRLEASLIFEKRIARGVRFQ